MSISRTSAPIDPKKKLIVFDVDDTLISGKTANDQHREAYFPDSLRMILEYAKNNPQVSILILSRVSDDEPLKKVINDLSANNPKVSVLGRETLQAALNLPALRQEMEKLGKDKSPAESKADPNIAELKAKYDSKKTNMKVSYIEDYIKRNGIDANNVVYVDDSHADLQQAVIRNYVPVVPPGYVPAGSKESYPAMLNSLYLDFLPLLVQATPKQRENFSLRVSELIEKFPRTGIAQSDYRGDQTFAKLFTELYFQLIATNPEPLKDYISNNLDVNIARYKEQFQKILGNDTYDDCIKLRRIKIRSLIAGLNTTNVNELEQAYKIVLAEKTASKETSGVSGIFKKQDKTTRWKELVAELQMKALELAKNEVKASVKNPAHEKIYADIFKLQGAKPELAKEFNRLMSAPLASEKPSVSRQK